MKHCLWAVAALAFVAVGPTRAGDIVYKPIDTKKFLVRPTSATANLAERAINTLGVTAANSIESNGYVKTINNLFSKKIVVPHTQLGPSPLPAPTKFASTFYKSYNQPVMPVMQPRRR